MGTKEDLANIAERVCGEFEHKPWPARTMTINDIPFESIDGADGSGRCSEFARECTEAAIGKGQHISPLFGNPAAQTERLMKGAGLRTHNPVRGDLCFMDCGLSGHVIVCLGDGRYAENTGGARGPGYNIGRIGNDFKGRSLRFYAVLPSAPVATGIRIVLLPGSTAIKCNPRLDGGVVWCLLRPVAEALGAEIIADDLATEGTIYLKQAAANQ